MAIARRIELFYDVISPYTYLGWRTLQAYKPRWGFALEAKPMFLGGVMMATKNQPPGMLKPKGDFLAVDLMRQAAVMQVPLLPTPSNFFSEAARQVVLMQRVLTASAVDAADGTAASSGQEPELDALTTAFAAALHADPDFRNGDALQPIDDEFIGRCCAVAGVSSARAEQLLQAANETRAKEVLKATTGEAVSRGAFGSPTMFVHDAGLRTVDVNGMSDNGFVFGSDRFEHIAMMLGESYEGPNPR